MTTRTNSLGIEIVYFVTIEKNKYKLIIIIKIEPRNPVCVIASARHYNNIILVDKSYIIFNRMHIRRYMVITFFLNRDSEIICKKISGKM